MNWWGWFPWPFGAIRKRADNRTTSDLCERLGHHYSVPVCFDAHGRAVYACSTCGQRLAFWQGRTG